MKSEVLTVKKLEMKIPQAFVPIYLSWYQHLAFILSQLVKLLKYTFYGLQVDYLLLFYIFIVKFLMSEGLTMRLW